MSANLKVCVLVVHENKVLLIKEWSEKKKVFAWNVIKGTMDRENESIYDCAVREAQEEANINVKLDKSLGVHTKYKGESIYAVYFMLTAEVVDGESAVANKKKQKTRNENITEVRWFDFNEISKMKKDDFVSGASYLAIQRYLNKETYPLESISMSLT